MMGYGFLDDDWEVTDSADSRRAKRRQAKKDGEVMAQVEGYDPQTAETQASLTSGYMEKPVAPWEKEKAEQSTGEYWAKNILGINSLFSPSVRKHHLEREAKYEDYQSKVRAAEGLREQYLGANQTLIENLYNDGDDSNNIQGILDWQVNTGQDLSFDDLSSMDPSNPLFANSGSNSASASSRNVYFDAEPFISDDGQFGYRQMTKDGSEPKVTMLPEGQYPKEWVIGANDHSQLWNEASGEYTVERSALSQAGVALDAVNAVKDEDWTAGIAGDLESFWKQKVTGDTDREQWAKKYAINIRNLQQIGLLPPGPATDRDVDIVMKGAPKDNASKEAWVAYLTSVNNLRRISSSVADSKLEHLQTNQGKMFGMAGWRPDIEAIENTVYGSRVNAQEAGVSDSPVLDDQGAGAPPQKYDPTNEGFIKWKQRNGL
jgi:hypothetical protein